MSGNTTISTDKLLRARLIASGRLRPNTNELEPIQLNPGRVVFRIDPGLDSYLSAMRDCMSGRSMREWCPRYMLSGDAS